MRFVAPLAGSVDRNITATMRIGTVKVAPLAGSVDRNASDLYDAGVGVLSLPSRGAWIEIIHAPCGGAAYLRRSPRGERG